MNDVVITAVKTYLKKDQTWVVALIIVLGAYFFLVMPIIFHGPYNPDEGWYVYDAWMTWTGHMPYRDFAFPQPPLILLFHGFWQVILGPSWIMARIVNASLGLLGVVLTAIIARRVGGLMAGIIAGSLLAFSPWYALQMASVNTYALASIFLLLVAYFILKNQGVGSDFLPFVLLGHVCPYYSFYRLLQC